MYDVTKGMQKYTVLYTVFISNTTLKRYFSLTIFLLKGINSKSRNIHESKAQEIKLTNEH